MIELQVVNKILNDGNLDFLKKNGFKADDFIQFRDEINFIIDFYKQYNKVPTRETFIDNFNDFEFIDTFESEDYLVDKFREENLYNEFLPVLKRVSELMKDNSFDAYNFLKGRIPDLNVSLKNPAIGVMSTSILRADSLKKRAYEADHNFISTGLKSLDDIIFGWNKGEELATIVGRPGQGKCLAKGTKVLMADGTLKNVEDVKVGDKVQSYNRINTVLALHNGVSKGYKIIPNRGESFIISENHILTLMKEKEGNYKNKSKIIPSKYEHELIDVTIEDYLKFSKHKKGKCRLFYPEVNYQTKELKIDPYILGLWLGDGTSREMSLTTMDKEVADAWCNYGKQFGLHINILNKNKSNKATTYYLGIDKGHLNPLLNLFREYNLINNKHIPLNYLTGDRQQRLQLLAGLLDSDGYLSRKDNLFEITFKRKELIEQTKQLAMGLGFRVGNIQTKYSKEYDKNYYRITICGDLKEIPMRVAHKIPKSIKNYHRTLSLTGFKVEPIERVEYYGFMCDGDERYILGNGILTHNTWLTLFFLISAWKQGYTVGLYSGEMSEESVGYRIDTLLKHFSNQDLIKGTLLNMKDYDNYIEEISKSKNEFYVLTPANLKRKATITDLEDFIDTNKIDILGVDQFSLLQDERSSKRSDTREELEHLSMDLFNLSTKKHIPILAVSQSNRMGAKNDKEKGTPDIENIYGSDSIAQNSTKVLTLRQKDDKFEVSVKKNRYGMSFKSIQFRWDIEHGVIEEIQSEEEINKNLGQTYRVLTSGDDPF